jgi:stromal membrane-associated protein
VHVARRVGADMLASGNATILRHQESVGTQVKHAVEAAQNLGPVPTFGSALRMKARSGLKGLKPWYTRWFVIDTRGITWYGDEAASQSASGSVGGRLPIHQLISAEALKDKGETRFVLHQKAPRGGIPTSIHLSAENPALMHRWLELISRHLIAHNGAPEGSDAAAALASSTMMGVADSAAASASAPRAQPPARPGRPGGGNYRQAGANATTAAQQQQQQAGPSADGTLIGEAVERRLGAIAGNETCADCTTSDPARHPNKPTWGSTNLGVVFCIRCSGVHRKLGAHITKVLSLQIDGWSQAQLEFMENKGNTLVNAELEHSLPDGYTKPDLAQSDDPDYSRRLEEFIRSKYELGSFKPGGDGQLATVNAGISTKAMDEFCGLLIIRLISGADLPKSDTFVEFVLGERKAKSPTAKANAKSNGGQAPTWNATLMINVRSLRESLVLKLFDAGAFGGPSFVGQALVPLEDLTHDGQPIGFHLTLSNGKRELAATVAVELTYNPLAQDQRR